MAIRARPKRGLIGGETAPIAGEYESHMVPMDEESPAQRRVVDIGEGNPLAGAGPMTVDLEAGTVVPKAPAGAFGSIQTAEKYDHYENVALRLSDTDLQLLGQKVSEAVRADLESRTEWESVLAAGTRMLTSGEVEDVANLSAPIKVVKNIKHPIFGIAVYQYQTRAYKQLLPPTGPAKCAITGKRTEELMQKSERVETYQNFQLMQEDPAYADQTDQLLLVQAIDGSTFRKWYRDTLLRRNVGRWVRGVDLIVPYGAESLESALRITHRYKESSADVHRKMLNPEEGYRQIALGEPPSPGDTNIGTGQMSELKEATDKLQGISAPPVSDEASDEYTFFEQQVYLDLSEHVDSKGNPTGVPLPYVVTIETETQQVVCVWRDWDEADQNQRRLQHFAHYKFLPGPGFYGLGYSHLLVGVAAGVTAAMRVLIVGSMYASAGGGFVTRDAAGKMTSNISIEPGLYKAIDLTHDDLTKAFYTPTFKEPSQALPNGIEMLLKSAERLSSTVEAMVGDAPTTGPVGTTLALIEQSGELYSGIHQRNHRAMGDELRMQFRLNGIYVPQGGYPYIKGDQDQVIFKDDFSEQIDVRPVSDPNIFSSTQRIALAQAQVQVAEQHPDVVNKRVAIKRLLLALRVPDPEELEVKPQQATTSDPLTENALVLMALPIRTDIKQDHDGHIMIHGQIVQDPNAPDVSKAAMAAHIAEHMAMKVLAMGMAAGLPVQIPQRGEGEPVQKIDPRVERQITQRAVQLVQSQNQQKPQGTPEQIQAQGEAAAKMAKVKGDLQREAGASKARIAIATNESQAKIRLKEAEQLHGQKIKTAAANFQQRLDGHAALMKAGTQGAQLNESQAGVDEAQAALTRAVSDLTDALSALAKQVEQDFEKILTEIQTHENTETPNA